MKATCLSLLIALACALAQLPAQAAGVDGPYDVKGKLPDGSQYGGKLTIKTDGAVLRMVFKDGHDGTTMRGTAIRRADNLFAAWGPNDHCTVSALLIKPDGDLDGPWGDVGHNQLGTESLRRQSGAAGTLDGTYASSGVDPAGNAYQGVTTVAARGPVFKLTFKGGGVVADGVGIQHAGTMAVAYGGAKCGVTVYSIKPDGSLTGSYAEYGQNALATEVITKGW